MSFEAQNRDYTRVVDKESVNQSPLPPPFLPRGRSRDVGIAEELQRAIRDRAEMSRYFIVKFKIRFAVSPFHTLFQIISYSRC